MSNICVTNKFEFDKINIPSEMFDANILKKPMFKKKLKK